MLLQGSELAYLYACVFLLLVPLLCAGAGYLVIKWQDERKLKFRRKQEALKSGAKVGAAVDKMCVREWLHANHKRFVKLRFGPESILHTVNRKGEKLRSVNFSNYETITIEESQVRINFLNKYFIKKESSFKFFHKFISNLLLRMTSVICMKLSLKFPRRIHSSRWND